MKKALKMLKCLVLMVTAIIALSACSGSPGAQELETMVKPKLITPMWDVTSIKKTSATVDEAAQLLTDSKVYDVRFDYEIKFKKSLEALKAELKATREAEMQAVKKKAGEALRDGGIWGGVTATLIMNTGILNARNDQRVSDLQGLEKEYGNFKAGDVKKLSGKEYFFKKDGKWVVFRI